MPPAPSPSTASTASTPPVELTDAQKQDIRTVRLFAANAPGYIEQARAAKAALSRLTDASLFTVLESKFHSPEALKSGIASIEKFPS